MAVRVGFGGQSSGGSNVAGTIYSDGVPLPVGRAMANGDTTCYVVELYGYVRGNGGSRTGRFRLHAGDAGAATADVTITAHSDSTPGSGYFPTEPAWPVSGGTGRFQWEGPASGPSFMGRGGDGTVHGPAGFVRSGMLGGAYGYIQAPTAPRSPGVAAGGVDSVTLSWVAPTDDGATPLQGYRIEYGTDPDLVGATVLNVGVVTSRAITGLTPGTTYYFRVAARNTVTTARGTSGVYSSSVSATLGAPPSAPGKPVLAVVGNAVEVSWTAPADTGGAALIDYTLEYSTSAAFASNVGSVTLAASVRRVTVPGLAPSALYYFRVKARNSVGTSPASASSNATTEARDVLDLVRGAAVSVGKTHVSIRSDGADAPTLTLGYATFGTGTAFVPIAVLPTGAAAGAFSVIGGARNLALTADPEGNLYVVGVDGANTSAVLVKRYAKTGATSWAPSGSLAQALPSTGDPLAQLAAAYVPGTGAAGVPSLLVLARRTGTLGTGGLSYATINPASVAASAGALFLNFGSNPSWLAAPPVGQPHNSGLLDATPLTEGGNRVAILADGFAVVTVTNGAVVGVTKSAGGAVVPGSWARILGVNATTLAMLTVVDGALTWALYSATNGALLGSGSYSGANAHGGAFAEQWDAYLNRVTGLIRIYYVADDDPRKLERIDVSPTTYAATAAAVVTSALGDPASVNAALRLPAGSSIDERRVIIEAANLLGGAKSTAAYSDRSGNVAPNAPGLINVDGFDAGLGRGLGWAFGDPNPLDAQGAYELEVQRVSDSVNVVATGKTASAATAHELPGGTLVNGIGYRWRVRAWDELDTAGAWSAYDSFITSALGELTITSPAADNPVGLDAAELAVAWSYTQSDGYVQTQRRVRVLEAAGGAVLSDSGVQASTEQGYTVAGLPSDVEVIIEVSIITNAPGTPTVTATRRVTSSYSSPLAPEVAVAVGESFIAVTITNPPPTGARPDIVRNDIERRPAGSGAPFVRIARVGKDGTYLDHAVASGAAYDYRVKGVSA